MPSMTYTTPIALTGANCDFPRDEKNEPMLFDFEQLNNCCKRFGIENANDIMAWRYFQVIINNTPYYFAKPTTGVYNVANDATSATIDDNILGWIATILYYMDNAILFKRLGQDDKYQYFLNTTQIMRTFFLSQCNKSDSNLHDKVFDLLI